MRSADMYSWMKSRQRERLRTRNRVFLVIACSVVTWWGFIIFCLLSRLNTYHVKIPELHQDVPRLASHSGASAVFGILARFAENTTEVVYAIPSKPKGIALVLHACTHSALKFFSKSPLCETCVGLSEELRISKLLLDQRYAILAVTSQDRKSGCWGAADMPKIRAALEEFQTSLVPSTVQVFAIGASSGGRFAAQLAAKGVAKAALVMVMSLGPELTENLLQMGDIMPSLYLAPMPRDKGTTEKAKTDYDTMMNHKPPPANVIFDSTNCVPLPVTPDYLHERVPDMSRDVAEGIVRALASAGHLDSNLYFVKDPTKSNWRNICGDLCSHNFNLLPGQSPLAKAFHRAWAFHEYCSETIVIAMEFFERSILS